MLLESDGNLCLVELMATEQSTSWNLNDTDKKAIRAVLNDRKELINEIIELKRLVDVNKPKEKPKDNKLVSHDVQIALDLCDGIIETIENEDFSRNSTEFVDSVYKKVKSMRESIESMNSVTQKMVQALTNMSNGINKCVLD